MDLVFMIAIVIFQKVIQIYIEVVKSFTLFGDNVDEITFERILVFTIIIIIILVIFLKLVGKFADVLLY